MTDDNNPDQRPYSKYDVLRRQPEVSNSKSYAQVATSVAQSVRQKSGGLKPVGKKDEKSETLGIRFKAGELPIIRTKALLAGCDTNTYIRAASLNSDYKQPRDPELLKAFNAAVRELTMQGVNLNQIAKHLNGGNVPLDEAQGLVGQIARGLFKAHDAIGRAITQGRMWPMEKIRK